MTRTRLLLVVALGGCTSGAASPPPATPPADDSSPTPTATAGPSTLGSECDDDRACNHGQVCRRLCADAAVEHQPGDCDPAELAFCDAATERRPLEPLEFMFVLHAGKAPLAVVARVDDPLRFGEQPATVLARTDDSAVLAHAAPPELVVPGLAAAAVSVFGVEGPVCKAELGEPLLVALEPYDPTASPLPAVGARVDADQAPYAVTNGAVFLAMRLVSDADCAGARWARGVDHLPVPSAAASPASAIHVEAATTEFAALPAARAHQARYATTRGVAEPSWLAAGPPAFARFTLDGRYHAVASASVGAICDDFAAQLMVSWGEGADASEAVIEALSWDRAITPQLAVDLDADGVPEYLEVGPQRARLWSATVTAPGEYEVARASGGC